MNVVRANYQQKRIPTGFGLYLFLPLLVVLSLLEEELASYFFFSLVMFGGLLDDLYGEDTYKGLGGHLLYFIERRVFNTALLKILFTSIGAIYLLLPGDLFLLSDLLLLLLTTNTINLFDLRPGRAMKGFLLFILPLLPSRSIPSSLLYFFIPFFFYLPKDLKGEGMLGDTGSNLLGALLGFLLLKLSPMYRLLSLSLFIVLHIFTEYYSLSVIIEKYPLLRRLDELGRRGD